MMSMLLMVRAMNTKVGNSSRKIVLIKLADHANDKGICWPSHEHIARHCEMSTRSVIRHTETLEKQGLIKVIKRKCSGESHNLPNLYFLYVYDDTANISSLESNDSDNLPNHSDMLSRDRDNLSKTIMTGCHPNQSLRTRHKTKPIIESNTNTHKKSELDLSKFDNHPGEKVWTDYLEHRKNKKAKLTQTALNALAEEINKANEAGWSTDEVLAQCMLRNWQGFKLHWFENDRDVVTKKINPVATKLSNPAGIIVVNG